MRTFPALPDVFNIDPALPILETLGVEDLAVTAPADGPGLTAAILSATPNPGAFDSENSAAATAPVFGPDFAEETVNTHNPMAGLATFDFDSSAEAGSSSPVIQSIADPSSFTTHASVDFGNTAPGALPEEVGESAPVEATAAAKGGVPGGGGGGGDGSGGILTQYFSGSPDGDAGYDIWIQFKGSGWTVDLQNAFKNAADYLTTVITDDIGGGGRIGRNIVDDLYVTAEVKAIDGTGGILGQAGPSSVWTASDLTAAGQMQFDIADATTYFGIGLWDDIVTHELMHVLGFGSLWNYGDHAGLVSGNEYTGANALAAYRTTHPGADFIPVETDGGSGTAGSHWDEGALDNELMTGYIDGNNFLSKFSVMSLADLGYHISATSYYDYPYDSVIG